MLNHIDPPDSRLATLRAWTNLNRLHTTIADSIALAVRESADLSMAEWEVLAALANRPVPLAVSEIARLTGWELSRVSRQISRLQVRLLVERLVVSGEQRYAPVGLTERGRTAVERARPAWETAVARSSTVMSAARRMLELAEAPRAYVTPWSASGGPH